MEKILVLGSILPALIDPWQQFLNLPIIVIHHKLAASTREIVTVEPRRIKDCLISFGFLHLVPSDLGEDVIEVEETHVLSEELDTLSWPSLHLFTRDVSEGNI